MQSLGGMEEIIAISPCVCHWQANMGVNMMYPLGPVESRSLVQQISTYR